MSAGRKYRRHLNRHRHEPHVSVVTQLACTEDGDRDAILEARRISHDSLIAALGARRRSGVEWGIYGPEDRDAALDVLEATPTVHSERWKPGEVERIAANGRTRLEVSDPQPGDYSDCRQWFQEHPAGWLVVAMANAIQ